MTRTIAHHDAILRASRPGTGRSGAAHGQHILESGDLVVAWFENRSAA